jgi:prevent-host-death family protein
MKVRTMPATFTSRDFNRDPGSIKRAALSGPVFITDRNKPSLVVLGIKDYERLAGRGTSLFDVLMPDDDQDFEFDPPKARVVGRQADLD